MREDCGLPDNVLEGWTVRVRHSKQEPFLTIGQGFKELLRARGAILRDVPDLDHVLSVSHQQERLDAIDSYLMVAGTTNVSAEAMELAHERCSSGAWFSARTVVTMPKGHGEGFIRKRLAFHGVVTELYEDFEVEDGTLCVRTLDHIISRKREAEVLAKKKNPRLGILTALTVEMEAFTSLLNDVEEDVTRVDGVLRNYVHGTLPARNGGKHEIVVVRTSAGNAVSAALAERLFADFGLDEVMMVGIAGGIPRVAPKHDDVRLGDIVVSGRKGVIQYDHVKERVTGPQPAHQPMAPVRAFVDLAETISGSETAMAAFNTRLAEATREDGPYKRPHARTDVLRDDRDPDNPVTIRRKKDERRARHASLAFTGAVGSATKVVKSHEERERVREDYGVIAVEMEGAGVAEAAMSNGKGFFVVRGICDYANDGKNDGWHRYASMAAAVFAVHLIESMPLSTTKTV
ncbi:5'-methylthioadenosine/S-adenosylhomocysteine nucleosidase [Methylorubrum aminovorans]|uniref:5'-methylthioadenosine/S-adenosylhomocysteine nucleosidase n=3 Tax=Methylorubrum aminovorans TaxID=269069 RepID=A0ABQ4UB84_9HYPH|nr:5'-methylthioadenosine/S-adenosylhomocysteine nucleosidase [Methylorubrum aminovorans]